MRLQYPFIQFVPDLTRRFSALDSRLSYSSSTEVTTPDLEPNDIGDVGDKHISNKT